LGSSWPSSGMSAKRAMAVALNRTGFVGGSYS
jgi:hypothetical protein